ncbi:hypothetical protein [uncultured Azonexus sp.]|uniref:hypothetical protein n=1 Tax=uncultured Azonexus sp. TaxID=520307 RepID=UPI00260C0A05|nr:hypothetical protein [uncultured Azonexus sp.]
MPSIFVKDDLRASVEAASGGKQTVLYTASGQPCYMNVIPKFLVQDIDAGLGSGVHPAFIVNGIEKNEIFVGAYQGIAKNGEFLSLPGVDPTASQSFDYFANLARVNGPGWHAISNVEFAALALWCWKNGFMPRGNTNYGKSSDSAWETGRRIDGGTPGDTAGTPRTLTGSGPASWRHDNSNGGIADLNGNIWEWTPGMRIVGGEIQIIENNNAALNATDFGATSAAWKAINGATGALVTPTFTGSIAGGDYVATTANSVRYAASGTSAYTLVRASGSSFEGMTNPGTTPVADAALQVLKKHGLFPVAATGLGGDGFWLDVTGERLPIRGGYWNFAATSGVFALNLNNARSHAYSVIGSRPAFVL